MIRRKQILVKQDTVPNLSTKTNGMYHGCTQDGCKKICVITDAALGETLCSSCGQVLEEKATEISSSYGYDSVDYALKKNTGSANSLTMFDMNMTTMISNRDATGKFLSGSVKNDFYRLKILNTRSTMSSNKTLRTALLFLNVLQTKLGIPDSVAENSAHLYRKATREKLTVGRKSKNIMCACLYASCKQNGVPRTINEISLTSNIGRKEITRTYRNLVENLNLSINPFNSKEFLTRIANEAQISEKSRRHALEILCATEEAGLTHGKNPKALAAASVYLACVLNAEHKSQALITKASGVTVTTVRTRYYDLKKFYLETM